MLAFIKYQQNLTVPTVQSWRRRKEKEGWEGNSFPGLISCLVSLRPTHQICHYTLHLWHSQTIDKYVDSFMRLSRV